MRYVARAPLRIVLGGDFSDTLEVVRAEGGATLTISITRYVNGRINRPDWTGPLRSLRSDRSYLSYSYDVPDDAGLGLRAAQTVLWVTLVRMAVQNDLDRRHIAEMSCQVSEALGILDGTGDEYASALGGITFRTFRASVRDESIGLDSATAEALRGRLMLVYSGTGRRSGSPRERLIARYREGDRTVTDTLADLRRLADDMKEALQMRDLDGLSELIRGSWAAQKQLDANPSIESLIGTCLTNGAIAAKPSGPEGGSVLFMTRRGEKEAVARRLSRQGLQPIDFDFDTYGVFVTKE